MTVRIVTDSTSDLPGDIIARYGIGVAPLYINFDQESYQDGVDISREDFYRRLPDCDPLPTTAAPGIPTFTQIYETLAAGGATAIISIHIAASLSATVNVARVAAKQASIPVTVLDSGSLTMGAGFLVWEAAKAAAEGRPLDEILPELEAQSARTHVFAALDTLEFLRRGGRLIYTWDMESTDGWFLRQHIAGGAPTQVTIDTSWTFQAYVYGDSSMNLIRFSLYETGGDAIAEVSLWDTLNWVGWKLIEWNLWDPAQIGEWGGVGLGTMDGTSYRLESIQLARTDSSAVSGTIWVDDIRLVKRTSGQAPGNEPPLVESLPDTSIEQGKRLRIFVNFTDPNPGDIHQIICESDTSDITFTISGHTSGDRVYINTASTFAGESLIRVIVKDFGVGELSDTTEFLLTVTPVVSVEDMEIPAVFALHGNYPNPFNPVTTIRYEIPDYNRVSLSLYDIRGSHITDLVDGYLPAGRYETVFDGSRFASGIYLIRLQSGAQQTVSRMVLLK